MTIIQAIILGIVQGLTEFLPISSSAHLVLVPYIFEWDLASAEAFLFDVLVQLGTLAAVIVYFWKDLIAIIKSVLSGIKAKQPLKESDSILGWMIILATIPAGLGGILLKDYVETAFSSPVITSVMLFITAALMAISEWVSKKTREIETIKPKEALLIGFFQMLAIFPGISRSGATISGGLIQNFDRKGSARFSFLMSIPIMLAAGLLALVDLIKMPSLFSFLPVLVIGFLIAGVVGYFSIAWLMRFLKKSPLYVFSLYCVLVSIVILILHNVR